MNSFSASKAFMVIAVVSATAAVLTAGSVDLGWMAVAAECLVVLAAGSAAVVTARADRTLRGIAEVCTKAANGDMEARILEAPRPGMLGETQRAVNRLIDISDAFVREAAGSMDAVSRGAYYRKVLVRGLPGAFGAAARIVNQATVATAPPTPARPVQSAGSLAFLPILYAHIYGLIRNDHQVLESSS